MNRARSKTPHADASTLIAEARRVTALVATDPSILSSKRMYTRVGAVEGLLIRAEACDADTIPSDLLKALDEQLAMLDKRLTGKTDYSNRRHEAKPLSDRPLDD
jgi:hypothetical protein